MNLATIGWPSGTDTGWPSEPRNMLPGRVEGFPQGTQAAANDAERLLSQAVAYWDASKFRDGDRFLRNRGIAGDLLDLRLGSSITPNTNDPKFLDWDGENYVYLPGVAGNYLSVPDEAALDITGDIEVVMKIKPGADWTTTRWASVYKREAWWFNQSFGTVPGQLRLAWRSGGLNKSVDSTVAVSANLGAAASVGWVKGTLDVDDGLGNHVVKFWTSPDGVTWTQLGTTVTTAGTTSIDTSTYEVKFGDLTPLSSLYYTGDLYRAIVKDGIDGTPVLDVDCSQITSGSNTSFTALTGQTVTISRSTSGRKSVAVTHPCWLFGTDDYMQVTDNWQHQLLNFDSGESLAVLAVYRTWASIGSGKGLIAKAGTNSTGSAEKRWAVQTISGSGPRLILDDGANITLSPTYVDSLGTMTIGVFQADSSLAEAYSNGTLALSASRTAGDIRNTYAMRVGSISSAYHDFEGIAFAIFRRALTPAEIKTISDYFTARIA